MTHPSDHHDTDLDPEAMADAVRTLSEVFDFADAVMTLIQAREVFGERKTTAYNQRLAEVATLDDTNELSDTIAQLHQAHDWKGCVDLMTVWIKQIHTLASPIKPLCDHAGAVQFTAFLKKNPGATETLRLAADIADGNDHDAFIQALEYSDQTRATLDAVHPVFQEALDVAVTDPQLIWPVLTKIPDLKTDTHRALAATLMLGIGAWHLRNMLPPEARYMIDARTYTSPLPSIMLDIE
jgi:hypothetical protein